MVDAALAAALSDRYALEHELGRGGMATVYLAEDRKHGRRVAIKVLEPTLAASLGRDRFLREIQIAARLSHPHILPLIDSGESGGFLYYVTPHVPDGSLRDRLAVGAGLPLNDALRILREIGSALDYAHRQGFVHRDVKPENILFTDGHAVLADFGIARMCCEVEAAKDALTEIGLVLGTPEYMSPEQAAGDSEIGAASDAYSLACVAYELLAGEPPLHSDSPRATMARQVTEIPRPVRTHRPEVPTHVERAVSRALAKDPARRFATIGEFITALETAGSGTLAPAAERAIAVLPFINASPEPDTEYLSDGITDELIDALAKVGGLRVAARASVFALKGKPADVRSTGARLGAAWVLEGTVRRAGPRLRITAQLSSTDDGRLLWSQRYDRQLDDMFAIQEEIATTIVDTLRANALADLAPAVPARRTPSVAAYGWYLKGRFAWNQRTQESVNEAIGYFEKAIAADPDYAAAYSGLADSYALSLDYRSMPVAEAFANAESYARQALALDDNVAEAHASLAWSLFIHDWNWEESGREFRRAVELDPRYATARQWHSFWLVAHRRFDEAIAEVVKAAELDPSSVSIRRSVGWVYYYSRRFEEARRHFERAVGMNPTADETYWVFGLALAALHLWDEAEAAMREAIAISGGAPYNMAMLGYVLGRSGRHAEAEAVVDELVARRRDGYVSPIAFATVHLGLGNLEQALDFIEEGYAERRGWLAYLTVNPMADPIRTHRRFLALVAKMKL